MRKSFLCFIIALCSFSSSPSFSHTCWGLNSRMDFLSSSRSCRLKVAGKIGWEMRNLCASETENQTLETSSSSSERENRLMMWSNDEAVNDVVERCFSIMTGTIIGLFFDLLSFSLLLTIKLYFPPANTLFLILARIGKINFESFILDDNGNGDGCIWEFYCI